MNAIIHAARSEMLGATLYLVGREVSDGSYVKNACPCSMCTRLIINAGIATVIVRDDKDHYRSWMFRRNGLRTTNRCTACPIIEGHEWKKTENTPDRSNGACRAGRGRFGGCGAWGTGVRLV